MKKTASTPIKALPLLIGTALIGLFIYGCIKSVSPPPAAPPKVTEGDKLLKGIRAYEAKRYEDAANLLRDLIASHPGSPLLMEAQWHLARTYLASGERDLAKRELSLFLRNYRNNAYEDKARLFLSQMELESAKTIAVSWSPVRTPRWKTVKRPPDAPEVNTILLEIPDEQLERLWSATVSIPLDDPLYQWIDSVQKAGFRVILKTALRTMPWATAQHPDWRDQRYDPQKQSFVTTEKLDLFHPEVKKMLRTIYQRIARYPIEGIYIDEIAYRSDEGWTPAAQTLYQNLFSEKLDPASLFIRTDSEPSPPELFHFAGIKSRYLAKLLTDIQKAIRLERPHVNLGIGIPYILFVDPATGLMDHSLDYLELKQTPFDFYVMTSAETWNEDTYESILKYGKTETIWFQLTPGQNLSKALAAPIQGVILHDS